MVTTQLEGRHTRWVIGAATGLVLTIMYAPPLYLLLISFNPGLLPKIPSLQEVSVRWYAAIVEDGRMLDALSASLLVAMLTAVISVLAALPAALAYMEIRRGRWVWFNFMLFSMFVPGVVQGLALSVIFQRTGIKPSNLTIVAGHLLWALPFAFIVILTNLSMLNRAYVLAARDLGASWLQVFRDVTLPLIRPGLVAALIFSFLLSFNEYNRAFYLVGRVDTLPIYMFGAMNTGASPSIYALSGAILVLSFAALGCALLILRPRQSG